MKFIRAPRFISFDAGFTLIYPFPKVGDVYANIASHFGYNLDGDEVHLRFLASWKRHTAENRGNRVDNAFTSEKSAYVWWREVFVESMGELLKSEDIDEVFVACFKQYALGKYWRIYPEVLQVLQDLKALGIELVILSNWDRRLRQTLLDLDLAKYFSRIYISTEIGFAKPQTEAFHHILTDRRLSPKEALHIGDSLEDDCLGARKAGLNTMLLDREKLQTNYIPNIPIIHSLEQLITGLSL